jgi:hypothetical protein
MLVYVCMGMLQGDEMGWKHMESILFPTMHIKPGCQMILAVDTLDIGQGTCQKILAYSMLLRTMEAFIGKVQFVIVINDHCIDVPLAPVTALHSMKLAYGASVTLEDVRRMSLLREISIAVTAVNAEFGNSISAWEPVVLITARQSPHVIRALMARCDVGYAAAAVEGHVSCAFDFAAAKAAFKLGKQKVLYNGSILYSDGAAGVRLLQGALICRPWDAEYTAKVIRDALELPVGDRHNKMEALLKVVASHSCNRWCNDVIEACHFPSPLPSPPLSSPLLPSLVLAINKRRDAHRPVTVILSLDTFISPLAALQTSEPLVAVELVTACSRLSSLPGIALRLVSGASATTLMPALKDYPGHIAAECGLEVRTDGKWVRKYSDPATEKEAILATAGRPIAAEIGSWIPEVLRILKRACDRTPGALMTRGKASLTWCWALADPTHGLYHAKKIHSYLVPILVTLPVVVALDYHSKVLAVRHISLTEVSFLADVAAEVLAETNKVAVSTNAPAATEDVSPLLCVLGTEQRPGDALMFRKAGYLRPGFDVWDINIACPPLTINPAFLDPPGPSTPSVETKQDSHEVTRTAKYSMPYKAVAAFLQQLADSL